MDTLHLIPGFAIYLAEDFGVNVQYFHAFSRFSGFIVIALAAGISSPARLRGQDKPSTPAAQGSSSPKGTHPNDDHISCELSERDLLALRPRPEQPTIDDVTAHRLKLRILEIISQDGKLQKSPKTSEFYDWVETNLDFSGLTEAQAKSKILGKIALFGSDQEGNASKLGPQELNDLARTLLTPSVQNLESAKTIQQKIAAQQDVTRSDELAFRTELAITQQKRSDIEATISLLSAARSVPAGSPDARLIARDLPHADAIYRTYLGSDALSDKALDELCDKKGKSTGCNKRYQKQIDQLSSLLQNKYKKEDLKAAQAALPTTLQQLNTVAEEATKAISAFARPEDVGCAMAVLPWSSMRYMFGQKIAEEYLGVQITVRNLNAEKEFLLHDAELAVDMDLSSGSPAHARYFSGVDKQNVRAYMLTARDYDLRSLVVHLAEGVSTVLGGAAPIWGGAVTEAASVYAGGFLAALTHVWTDHHTDQLNELNDVGFSASRNDRTFVPKSGSTQFVIFYPVKPLEQAWWTQRCAHFTPLDRSAAAGAAKIGLDTEALRSICIDLLSKGTTATASGALTKGQSVASPSSESSQGVPSYGSVSDSSKAPGRQIRYFAPDRVRYRNWTPVTYALLKEVAFSVVAGTHVTLSSDTHPDVTQTDCPRTGTGDINYDAAKSGVISCSISGVNLDKADHITLRSVTDTQTLDVPIKSANGGKIATLDFKVSDLCGLKDSSYRLFTVTGNGIEDGGTQSLHLSSDPYLTGVDPTTIASTDGKSITLSGCHLGNISNVRFGRKDVPETDAIPTNLTSPQSATISPEPKVFAPFGTSTDGKSVALNLFLTSKENQSNPRKATPTIIYSPPAP